MRPGASTRFRAQRWLDHGRHGRRRRPGDPPGINGPLFWLPSAPGLTRRSVVGARDQAQGDLPDQQVDRDQQQRDREHQQVADLAEGAHISQLGVDGQAEHHDGARQEHAAQQHGRAALGRRAVGSAQPGTRGSPDHSVRIFFAVPRSAWVDLNLRRSLEDMGHTLVRFDFPGWPDDADPIWQRLGKPRTNERLLRAFRDALRWEPIDLFYSYLYSSVAYPETIDLIRQSGVPAVNFSCNNVHQFDLVRDIAPRFDACVVPEAAAQHDFRAVGARPLRIQLAANPRVYRPYPEPRVYDVTFVGQRYADRAAFLRHLYD